MATRNKTKNMRIGRAVRELVDAVEAVGGYVDVYINLNPRTSRKPRKQRHTK